MLQSSNLFQPLKRKFGCGNLALDSHVRVRVQFQPLKRKFGCGNTAVDLIMATASDVFQPLKRKFGCGNSFG